jgi:hypothetical protein
MFRIDKKKQLFPFVKLFQAVSPEEFVTIFNSELAQTKAFILSFSSRKSYVKKVLRLLDIQELSKKDLPNKSSFVIREYLSRCQKDIVSLKFVQAIEKEVESMIAGYRNYHGSCNMRKKLLS